MRFKQQFDGDWIKPKMRGYLIKCCDCGLVHKLNFRVIRWGRGHKVMFQAFRKNINRESAHELESMEEMNYRSETATDVTALRNAAFAACQQFDKQSGRFFESMGDTSPRLLAVVKAMDDLKAELYRLDHTEEPQRESTEQPSPGYTDFVQQIRQAPKTWLPGLLVEVAECCAAKDVFQPEGMLKLLQSMLKERQK